MFFVKFRLKNHWLEMELGLRIDPAIQLVVTVEGSVNDTNIQKVHYLAWGNGDMLVILTFTA